MLGSDLNVKNNLKYPCVICNKSVQSNQNGITCDQCGKWCHRKCDAMSPEMYEYYVDNQDNHEVSNQIKSNQISFFLEIRVKKCTTNNNNNNNINVS